MWWPRLFADGPEIAWDDYEKDYRWGGSECSLTEDDGLAMLRCWTASCLSDPNSFSKILLEVTLILSAKGPGYFLLSCNEGGNSCCAINLKAIGPNPRIEKLGVQRLAARGTGGTWRRRGVT